MSDKNLCKWKKDAYKDKFDKLRDIVKDARFACKKCGRAAREKDRLCEPKEL